MSPNLIKTGFSNGDRLGYLTIRVAEAGELWLSSGRVVACDPGQLMHEDACPAFSRTVPPGHYPVRVSVAEFDSGGWRAAFAALILDPAKPVRYELATRPGEDVATLEPGESFGHGVDTGTSCFIDVEAARVVFERCKDRDYCWKGGFTDLRCLDRDDTSRNAQIDPASGSNMIVFPSGIGDGRYASYWGFDAADRLVCLVTDFEILNAAEQYLPRCPMCGVGEGEIHAKFPCDAERCPFCGEWLCACGCIGTILGLTEKERELADRFYEKIWWNKDRRKWTEIYDRWRVELSRKGRVPFEAWQVK